VTYAYVSAKRSRNMAAIGSRRTQPEVDLARILRSAGIRFRRHLNLPGHPDFVIRDQRLAVFVDGCFWHGCPVHYMAPSTRFEFWCAKLDENADRDRRVDLTLRSRNWVPLHLWQHELRDPNAVVRRIRNHRNVSAAFGWWACSCGSGNAQLVSVSGPGSLRPGSKRPPKTTTFFCRDCGQTYELVVPGDRASGATYSL